MGNESRTGKKKSAREDGTIRDCMFCGDESISRFCSEECAMLQRIKTQHFSISSQKSYPSEYLDFIMITKVYHCTPSEYYAQDAKTIALHKKLYNLDISSENMKIHREEQKRANSKK